MKFTLGVVLGGFLVWLWFWATTPHTMIEAHDAGFRDGHKKALKTNPPSEELEIACVSLWFGDKGQQYWRSKNEKTK